MSSARISRIGENFLDASPDGKYVLVTTQNGDGGDFMHHLRTPDGKWIQLTKFEDQISSGLRHFRRRSTLFTFPQGRRAGKILRLPLATPDMKNAKVVVPESAIAIDALRFGPNRLVTGFTPTASGLYVVDVDGGPSRLRFVTRNGKTTVVPLPPVASVVDVVPVRGDTVLVQVETYLQPRTWYTSPREPRNENHPKLASTSPADYSDCEVVANLPPRRMARKCR